jgi:hypothetical protein
MIMKTTLFLSALAASVLAVSTATFAQEGGANWSQAYGDATVRSVPSQRYVAPLGRFTRSDLGYAGRVTTNHHRTR